MLVNGRRIALFWRPTSTSRWPLRLMQKEQHQTLTVRPRMLIDRMDLSHRPSRAHRSSRHRTRGFITPVCGRYGRPQLADVGSVFEVCCCGFGARQLAACSPRQRSVHAPSCAVVRVIGYTERQRRGMVWVAMASVSHAQALYMVRMHDFHDHTGLGWPREASGVRR